MPQIKVIQQLTQVNSNIILPNGALSDPVSLDGASTFSAQISCTGVGFSDHTFDNGAQATLALQDIDYTSVSRGGNDITIAYFGGGTAGGEVVNVVGTAISVQIDDGVSTADQIVTALEASGAASALITCEADGNNPITWTDILDVSLGGGNLKKTGGADAWDAGAFSSSLIATEGSMSFRALNSGVTKNWQAGLIDADPAGDYAGFPYSIAVQEDSWQVIQMGANGFSGPNAYTSGDVLEIRVSGGTVGYYQNGALIYTSLDAYPGNLYASVVVRSPQDVSLADEFSYRAAASPAQDVVSATPLTGGTESEVDTSTEAVEVPSHGYPTGLAVNLTTTGTLPGGLAIDTDYYIIAVDEDHVQFALSAEDAEAGTYIDLTTQGSSGGVDTIAPLIATGTVQLQTTCDSPDTVPAASSPNWVGSGTAISLAFPGPVLLEKLSPPGNWMRLRYVASTGSVTATAVIVTKGPN